MYNVEEMRTYICSMFNTALLIKADKIVFVQYNINKFSLKGSRFVVTYLEQDKHGNETVISLSDNIFEIDNNGILYEAINKFKEKFDEIPIEVLPVLSDLPIKCINKFYNEILENITGEILGEKDKIKKEKDKFDNVYNSIKEIKDKLTKDEKMKIIKLLI